MPLAYVQLVQILTDGLILSTPFALVHALGGRASFGVVCGTAVVTLFHSSIVMLAKLFLDPFNNEVESRGGDPGIGGIEVDTLLQQTNVGSERWRRSAASVPEAAWRPLPPPPPARAEEATEAAEPGLVERIFGMTAEPPPKAKAEAPQHERDDPDGGSESMGGGEAAVGAEG
jgi:hypothetical protein